MNSKTDAAERKAHERVQLRDLRVKQENVTDTIARVMGERLDNETVDQLNENITEYQAHRTR